MPAFSRTSQKRLSTCDTQLQRVCNEAIKITDFSVICGHRDREEQEKAFQEGHSKLEWPDSRHNPLPSEAVDVGPSPLNWNDRVAFAYLAGVLVGIGHMMGVELEWGGHWKMKDLPHLQIKRKSQS